MNDAYIMYPIWFLLILALILFIVAALILLILYITKHTRKPKLPLFRLSINSSNNTFTNVSVSWDTQTSYIREGDVITVYITQDVPNIVDGQVTNFNTISTSSKANENGNITISGLTPNTNYYVTVIVTSNDTISYSSITNVIYTQTSLPNNDVSFVIGSIQNNTYIGFRTGATGINNAMITDVNFYDNIQKTFVYNKSGDIPYQLVSTIPNGVTGPTGYTEWVLINNNGLLGAIRREEVSETNKDDTQWEYKNNFWCLMGNSNKCIASYTPNIKFSSIAVAVLPDTPTNITMDKIVSGYTWENLMLIF